MTLNSRDHFLTWRLAEAHSGCEAKKLFAIAKTLSSALLIYGALAWSMMLPFVLAFEPKLGKGSPPEPQVGQMSFKSSDD